MDFQKFKNLKIEKIGKSENQKFKKWKKLEMSKQKNEDLKIPKSTNPIF